MSDIPKEIASALVAYQKDQAALVLDASGQRSKYASLGSIMTQIKEAADKHKLGVICLPKHTEADGWHIQPVLVHESGATWSGDAKYPMEVDDFTNSQKIGSALSYGRRYALMAMLGMAAGIQDIDLENDDDDGEVNGNLDTPPKQTKDASSKPYDLDALINKLQTFKTLTSLNAFISEQNKLLTEMHKSASADYNRFYSFWQAREEELKNG
tara:strand:- start:1710 stop:2345 length:636 start_codon:yes stop_codon:yes gene_type:complete